MEFHFTIQLLLASCSDNFKTQNNSTQLKMCGIVFMLQDYI